MSPRSQLTHFDREWWTSTFVSANSTRMCKGTRWIRHSTKNSDIRRRPLHNPMQMATPAMAKKTHVAMPVSLPSSRTSLIKQRVKKNITINMQPADNSNMKAPVMYSADSVFCTVCANARLHATHVFNLGGLDVSHHWRRQTACTRAEQ